MTTNRTALAWGAEIKRLRGEQELSRADLADKVGVTASMVGLWETGRHAPSSRMQAALLDLGVDLAEVAKAMKEPA